MARCTKKAMVPIPRMPRQTITATMMRIIFSALLLWAGAVAAGAATGAPAAAPVAEPHLGQKRAPGSMAVPQELQKAIHHLGNGISTEAGVYRKSKNSPRIQIDTKAATDLRESPRIKTRFWFIRVIRENLWRFLSPEAGGRGPAW